MQLLLFLYAGFDWLLEHCLIPKGDVIADKLI